MAELLDLHTALCAEVERRHREATGLRKELAQTINGLALSVRKDAAESARVAVSQYQRQLADSDRSLAPWTALVSDLPDHPTLPSAIRIGSRREYAAGVELQLPVVWRIDNAPQPLLIHAEDDDAEDTATALLQATVLRLGLHLGTTARYTLLDPAGLGSAFPFAGRLPRRSHAPSADLLRTIVSDVEMILREKLPPGETELLTRGPESPGTFEVVAIDRFPEGLAQAEIQLALKLCAHGPRAGKFVLMTHRRGCGHELDPSLRCNCQSVHIDGQSNWTPERAPLREHEARIASAISSLEPVRPTIDWSSAAGLPEEEWWSETSRDTVSTPIGTGSDGTPLPFWIGERTDGRLCVHGALAGQTGTGKSTLYQTIILGLCVRYSPDELQLILIDGKQGVSFQPYAALPHTRIVSLHTSPDVARSVLPELLDEAEQRYQLFRTHGVDNLTSYRKLAGRPPLPRILVLVDEYQQLFEEDVDQTAQAYLRKLVEQGRGAGVHIVLGSQRFKPKSMGDSSGIFAQLQLRMSLALTEEDRTSIRELGREARELLAECQDRGEILVNDAGGADGKNRLGRVAFCPLDQRQSLIESLRRRWGQGRPMPAANVLDGEDRPRLWDVPLVRKALGSSRQPANSWWERQAQQPERMGGLSETDWLAEEAPTPVFLGAKKSLHGQATVTLRRRRAENLVIAGGEPAQRCDLVIAVVASLALSTRSLELMILDSARGPERDQIANAATRLASTGITITVLDGPSALEDLMAQPDSPVALVVTEVDTADEFAPDSEHYPPRESPAATALQRIASQGPQDGTHVVASFGRVESARQILKGSLGSFRHRVALPMSESESHHFINSRSASRLAGDSPPSAVLHDAQSNREVPFLPFARPSQGEVDALVSKLLRWRTSQ